MSGPVRIVIAAPHKRYDSIEFELSNRPEFEVLRIRNKLDLDLSKLLKFNPRYIFFPHWSWRIQEEIFKKYECVVFHMTDLPYGRGGSPLQNLVMRGHTETKLSAIQCVEDLDAGPIYIKRPLSLSGSAEVIFVSAAKLMLEMIQEIASQRLEPTPQFGVVTEFQRRSPKDSNLSGLNCLKKLYDHIRMLDADGYPSAFIENDHFKFEFRGAILSGDDLVAEVKITRRVQ